MLITCCLLAADGVLQISGKWKSTSGKMEDKENGKTPAQLKDELSGLKMRALQQKAEEVGVAQDQIDEADDSKENIHSLCSADPKVRKRSDVSWRPKRQQLLCAIPLAIIAGAITCITDPQTLLCDTKRLPPFHRRCA